MALGTSSPVVIGVNPGGGGGGWGGVRGGEFRIVSLYIFYIYSFYIYSIYIYIYISDFISKNCDFISKNCDFISHNPEKKVRIVRKKSKELRDIFLQFWKHISLFFFLKIEFCEIQTRNSDFFSHKKVTKFSQLRVYISQFCEKSLNCEIKSRNNLFCFYSVAETGFHTIWSVALPKHEIQELTVHLLPNTSHFLHLNYINFFMNQISLKHIPIHIYISVLTQKGGYEHEIDNVSQTYKYELTQRPNSHNHSSEWVKPKDHSWKIA